MAVMRRLAFTSGLAIAAALLTSTIESRAQDLVEPSTNPMWASLSLGPAIGVANFPTTQFKLTQEFGYHFSGEGEGPALGLSIGESFGDGVFVFQPGPKFWWDIQIMDDLGIYVTPQAQVGYGLLTGFGATSHNFNWLFGVEGRVVLGDRGIVTFRPLSFDFFAGDVADVVVRYDLMFGGGVTF